MFNNITPMCSTVLHRNLIASTIQRQSVLLLMSLISALSATIFYTALPSLSLSLFYCRQQPECGSCYC